MNSWRSFSSPERAGKTRTSIWLRSETISLCPGGATNARFSSCGIPCRGGFSHAILPVAASSCFHLACALPFWTLVCRNLVATSPTLRKEPKASASGMPSYSANTFLPVLGTSSPADFSAQRACGWLFQLTSSFRSSGTFLFLVLASTNLSGRGSVISESSLAVCSAIPSSDSRTHAENTASSTGIPKALISETTMTIQFSRSRTAPKPLQSALVRSTWANSCRYSTSVAAYLSCSGESSAALQSEDCLCLDISTSRSLSSSSL